MEYTFTEKQKALHSLIKSPSKYVLAWGGYRSGKTFGQLGSLIFRALLTPGSRNLIVRKTRHSAKYAAYEHSLKPTLKALLGEGFGEQWSDANLTVWLPNGASIHCIGADDKPLFDALLGTEYTTVLIDDASEFDTADVMWALARRLSQKLRSATTGKYTRPKMLLTANPGKKSHWLYKVFLQGLDPSTGKSLANPEAFASINITVGDDDTSLPERFGKFIIEGDEWTEEPKRTIEIIINRPREPNDEDREALRLAQSIGIPLVHVAVERGLIELSLAPKSDRPS